jgi:hypothetical protein
MVKGLGLTGTLAAALLVLVFGGSASAQVPTSACPKTHTSNTTSVCPTISGSLTAGAFIAGSSGEWTGSQPIAFAFQWQRCTAFEASTCLNIPGENETKYLIASADAGNRLRLIVTAINGEGSDSRASAFSNVVGPAPNSTPGYDQTFPASLEALSPATLSSPLAGDTLRIADGPGSPVTSDGWFNPKATSYAYIWRRCAAGGALETCQTIAGATQRSYTLTAADAGHSVLARLTGSASGWSKALLTPATNPVGFPDRDGDGFTLDRDCNDRDPAIRPRVADAPGNGVDEDCSGADAAIAAAADVPPVLDSLTLSPSAFRAATSGPTVGTTGGTKVGYRLSEAATVTFTVEHPSPGVRQRRRCVKPQGPIPASAKRCTRYVAKGSFTDAGGLGANSLRFSGRVKGKPLTPGPYRLAARAKDAAGNRSTKSTMRRFTVLPAASPSSFLNLDKEA